MTREIAIRYCDEYLGRHISDIDKEFLKIAKEALQQEPCADCVSRKAAIDAIQKLNIPEDMCVFEIKSHIEVKIATLPPVTPQQKMGHWIDITNKHGTVIAIRCSRCKESPKHAIKSDFCPNCGAKMQEVKV